MKNTVARYCELARGLTGQAPTLKQVSTPFLHEGHRGAPAAMPHSEGHATICPWCRRSFTEPGTAPKAKKAKKKGSCDEKGDAKGQGASGGGRLKPIAASILMQVLCVACVARCGLLRPTCRLACYVSKWSDARDRRLFQLIRYIHSAYHLRQVG